MTSVVVLGTVGAMPLGGHAMQYLQYCMGLRSIGVDVLYLEDNRAWPFDPRAGEFVDSPATALAAMQDVFGSRDVPWAYMAPDASYHGRTFAEVEAFCAGADLLLNLSAGHVLKPHHRRAKAVALVDTDPGYPQVLAASGHEVFQLQLASHDLHFTFGERIGQPDCKIPTHGLHWRPTRQPIHLPLWEPSPAGVAYTTVLTWQSYDAVEWEGERWGQKGDSFPLIERLPARVSATLEVAVPPFASPEPHLSALGWRVQDSFEVSRDVRAYTEYIAGSRGEVSIAKEGYVRSLGGWFSERSANYLASGKPVVLQDTGWQSRLPVGNGLFSFDDEEGAARAVEEIERDWLRHSLAARRVAEDHFDARVVLQQLLSEAGVE